MSMAWTSTLRLPQSTFLVRVPQEQLREQYLQRCTQAFYKWQIANRPAHDQFVLHDGPPYANGSLHVGHALNKILKDVINRVKVQQGRRVKYVPGWDCHGLPIEIKALEAVGSARGQLTPVEIRASARALATMTVLAQMKEFQSYAVMADWEGRWTTMDPSYEIKQLQLFQQMVQKGLVYRSYKPVYWSPSSGTALAEAELEYQEAHVSFAAYVVLPIVADKSALRELLGEYFNEPLYALIWTTTPWTLPANKAIAIHDDIDYSISREGSRWVIIATKCLETVNSHLEKGKHLSPPLKTVKGSGLRNLKYRNPLQGKDAPPQPFIHASFVSDSSGSGLVHCAPGHGFEDYGVCKPLGLEVSAPVDDNGSFTKDAYPEDPQRLQGLPVLAEGNKAVLALLDSHVLRTHRYKHKYPYDWRTKKPTIVRATAQWFADVAGIKDSALKALEDVRFIPTGGKKRLKSFVNGRSEWCISRQRAWGVPIPALYDQNGDAVMTEESVHHIISVIKERGIDAWWSDASNDPAWIPSCMRGNGEYRRGEDTMDVWFDSGSSWTQEGNVQADVYFEGSDQHRGWFQSSLLTRVATRGTTAEGSLIDQTVGLAPFKHLITHGFTLSKDGKKMSKSLGNILTPNQIMDGSLLASNKGKGKKAEAFGPDALRLWATSSDYTRDILISEPVLKSVHTNLNKYRNIIRMLLGSIHESGRTTPMTALDRIAIIQLKDTMDKVGKAYDNFEFYKGVSSLNIWINNDLSAFYLEALKDRLYCGDGGGVLEPILMGFLRMLAPITPMLVEEAWDQRPDWLKNDTSVLHPLHQLYASPLLNAKRDQPLADQSKIREAIPALLAAHAGVKSAAELARKAKYLGSSLQCSVILEVPDAKFASLFEQFGDELENMFVVSSVDINTPIPDDAKWKCAETFIAELAADNLPDHMRPSAQCTAWVLPPKQSKCPRCWRYVAPKEDELCHRCEDVIQEKLL